MAGKIVDDWHTMIRYYYDEGGECVGWERAAVIERRRRDFPGVKPWGHYAPAQSPAQSPRRRAPGIPVSR